MRIVVSEDGRGLLTLADAAVIEQQQQRWLLTARIETVGQLRAAAALHPELADDLIQAEEDEWEDDDPWPPENGDELPDTLLAVDTLPDDLVEAILSSAVECSIRDVMGGCGEELIFADGQRDAVIALLRELGHEPVIA